MALLCCPEPITSTHSFHNIRPCCLQWVSASKPHLPPPPTPVLTTHSGSPTRCSIFSAPCLCPGCSLCLASLPLDLASHRPFQASTMPLTIPGLTLIFPSTPVHTYLAVTVSSDCGSLGSRAGDDSGLVPRPKGLSGQLGCHWR